MTIFKSGPPAKNAPTAGQGVKFLKRIKKNLPGAMQAGGRVPPQNVRKP